jgi:hypothetical protein
MGNSSDIVDRIVLNDRVFKYCDVDLRDTFNDIENLLKKY